MTVAFGVMTYLFKTQGSKKRPVALDPNKKIPFKLIDKKVKKIVTIIIIKHTKIRYQTWSISPLSEQVQELWVMYGVNTEWKGVSDGKMYPIYPCTSGPFLPKNWSKKKLPSTFELGQKLR